MLKTYKYESLKFFLLTFMVSWSSWLLAIYVSRQAALQLFLLPLILGGIAGPAISALIILVTSKNKELRDDFLQRFRLDRIKRTFIPIMLLLFPCQIVLAIALSLLFGETSQQFSFVSQASDQALNGIHFLTMILVIFLVGPFEEIGWRGYGIDSLRTKKINLFQVSLIFGALWGLWHFPLFFVKNGAFQEIWGSGLFHTFIYFFDLILLSILTNWLYIKNNRSILIAIIFHSVYDVCISLFHIEPVTWIILTLILLLTAVIIVKRNKNMFFSY